MRFIRFRNFNPFIDSLTRQVHAVSTALRDNSLLVQRNMLDFLLDQFFLPVVTTYLSSKEKVTLVASGLEVLLRRDMSLNRRLYMWLLRANSAKTESVSRTYSVCNNDADPEEPQEKLLLELSCFPVWAGEESKSEKSATDGNEGLYKMGD